METLRCHAMPLRSSTQSQVCGCVTDKSCTGSRSFGVECRCATFYLFWGLGFITASAGLKLEIFLPRPPRLWNSRGVPAWLAPMCHLQGFHPYTALIYHQLQIVIDEFTSWSASISGLSAAPLPSSLGPVICLACALDFCSSLPPPPPASNRKH